MNLAFKPEIIPAPYFLLMGHGYEFDRFGDIWSGIILKKICDHLGYAITSGEPVVHHRRASNVWANLRKEDPGLEVNEEFWRVIDKVCLSGKTFVECYQEIARSLPLEANTGQNCRKRCSRGRNSLIRSKLVKHVILKTGLMITDNRPGKRLTTEGAGHSSSSGPSLSVTYPFLSYFNFRLYSHSSDGVTISAGSTNRITRGWSCWACYGTF